LQGRLGKSVWVKKKRESGGMSGGQRGKGIGSISEVRSLAMAKIRGYGSRGRGLLNGPNKKDVGRTRLKIRNNGSHLP